MCWKLICFDLDNTLFDHELAFEKTICCCYRQLIYDLQWNDHDNVPSPKAWFARFKKNSDHFWALFENGERTKLQYRRIRFRTTMKSFELPSSDTLADVFHEKYDQSIHDYIEPYPGVRELFDHLRENNIDVGVITNGARQLQQRKANKLQLYNWMTKRQLLTSEQFDAPKPERKMFDIARERNDVLQHSTPLFVGDSWEHDILGALDAGWNAIYLNTRNEAASTNDQVIAGCRTFQEVSETIRNRLA